ncbi:MAG: hypothetical protein HRU20_28620 [Pseudomonadales bacterium]|nr:hypothetical protein [Pseudomonadales bacterium]
MVIDAFMFYQKYFDRTWGGASYSISPESYGITLKLFRAVIRHQNAFLETGSLDELKALIDKIGTVAYWSGVDVLVPVDEEMQALSDYITEDTKLISIFSKYDAYDSIPLKDGLLLAETVFSVLYTLMEFDSDFSQREEFKEARSGLDIDSIVNHAAVAGVSYGDVIGL